MVQLELSRKPVRSPTPPAIFSARRVPYAYVDHLTNQLNQRLGYHRSGSKPSNFFNARASGRTTKELRVDELKVTALAVVDGSLKPFEAKAPIGGASSIKPM